jgi:hypothetical protein
MPSITPEFREARSWKEISQQVNPRTLSAAGRRRLAHSMAQGLLLVVLLAVGAWGAWEIVHTLRSDSRALGGGAGGAPLRELVVLTDGVLPEQWVRETLALPPDAGLMALDLFALRERLLASGQVRAADLRRNFPDTLVVTLQERLPVARVRAQFRSHEVQDLLVAADGEVYEGFGYDGLLLASLPYLDGVRLVRTERGFRPIAGMEHVARLLHAAQYEAEHLYRTWRVLSLARLADHHEIVVRTRDIPEIVFNRRDDLVRQLARLDYIVDFVRSQPGAALQRVDLSHGAQVPVELHAELSAAPRGPNPTTVSPLNRTRTRPRDL